MEHSHGPERIVCLQPSATVILAGVGALDRVVACTKYCPDVVPELETTKRIIVTDSWTAKATEILAAKPDLVIASVPYQEAAVIEILKAGIRFLGLAPRTLNDIYTDIATIAACVGRAKDGAKMIAEMQAEIGQTKRTTARLPRRRVFSEEWGNPIITSQPWVAELVEAAGGEFLGKPGAKISAEEVARMDPEVIVMAWCGAGNRVPLEKVVRKRNWLETAAVRNSQIYCISDELLNTPAPTLLQGLRALASAIHAEDFHPQISGRRGIPKELRRITEVSES